MTNVSSLKLAMLGIAMVAGFSLLCQGETTKEKTPNDLTHLLHIETGGSWLRNGDRITIDQVHGTADTLAAGNLYEIKGTYKLASHAKASLAAFVTSSSSNHYPTMNTQSMTIQNGEGRFTVYLYLWEEGNPHISFYPTDGGQSFASLYFGTGNSVLKHVSWLDDPTP